jgi:NADPH-dependent curcumin reductase CurA
MKNRMVKLARRPKGMVTREDFSIEDGPVPEPGPAELYTGGNRGKLVLKV